MRDARREHPPKWGCDRRATKQMARRRPAPPGWGSFACWLRCSFLTNRWGLARRPPLPSKPNSLQQNRNLFLNGPLGSQRRIPTLPRTAAVRRTSPELVGDPPVRLLIQPCAKRAAIPGVLELPNLLRHCDQGFLHHLARLGF